MFLTVVAETRAWAARRTGYDRRFPGQLVPEKGLRVICIRETIRVRGYQKLLIALIGHEAAREHVNQFVYVRSDDLPELRRVNIIITFCWD